MQRILRTYQYIAHMHHFCDLCCEEIRPGEEYAGQVNVINGKIVVFKTHMNPGCDFPPDPDDFGTDDIFDEIILKLAA